jgi:hypothetical protein
MEDRILTQHPQGKAGVNISRTKYATIKAAILETLRTDGDATFEDLVRRVEHRLTGSFDGSIPWYVTTVKLDLEVRGLIERVPQSNPQRLRVIGE